MFCTFFNPVKLAEDIIRKGQPSEKIIPFTGTLIEGVDMLYRLFSKGEYLFRGDELTHIFKTDTKIFHNSILPLKPYDQLKTYNCPAKLKKKPSVENRRLVIM
jgi:hypothetical protein